MVQINTKKTNSEKFFEIVNISLLMIITLLIIYPLLFTISASFSDPKLVTGGKVFFLPKGFTLESYREVFKNNDILIGYRNTILITIAGTLVNLIMTILAAYPLSRHDLWGRKFFMMMFTFTMFFGGGIIPFYLVVQKLNLLDSWLSLILPIALSTYNMIIMRTYFETSIPKEIQEAALIDGATNIQILTRIVLPLSGAIIAVLALYYSVGHWNSYFNAMLFIDTRSKYPLQLFLREVLVMNQAQNMQGVSGEELSRQIMRAETIKYSVIVISSVPMLAFYPFVQKFFVKGVMIGAIKG